MTTIDKFNILGVPHDYIARVPIFAGNSITRWWQVFDILAKEWETNTWQQLIVEEHRGEEIFFYVFKLEEVYPNV